MRSSSAPAAASTLAVEGVAGVNGAVRHPCSSGRVAVDASATTASRRFIFADITSAPPNDTHYPRRMIAIIFRRCAGRLQPFWSVNTRRLVATNLVGTAYNRTDAAIFAARNGSCTRATLQTLEHE